VTDSSNIARRSAAARKAWRTRKLQDAARETLNSFVVTADPQSASAEAGCSQKDDLRSRHDPAWTGVVTPLKVISPRTISGGAGLSAPDTRRNIGEQRAHSRENNRAVLTPSHTANDH
jgi:hypothetical protein